MTGAAWIVAAMGFCVGGIDACLRLAKARFDPNPRWTRTLAIGGLGTVRLAALAVLVFVLGSARVRTEIWLAMGLLSLALGVAGFWLATRILGLRLGPAKPGPGYGE